MRFLARPSGAVRLVVVAVTVIVISRAAIVRTAGQWTTVATPMPINPVHVALLNNGKVLIVSGSGNVAGNTNFQAGLWDPARPLDPVLTQPVGWDMFCNGMVVLPDGRAFVNGGTLAYDPFHGERRSAVFDPATNLFTDVQSMAHGRWYPTVTTLGDGRVMTFSGLTETGATNTSVEIYTPDAGWSSEYAAGWTPPLYPRMHLLPNGSVFYSGSGRTSRFFNPSTHTWTTGPNTIFTGSRTYGTSVLLPLTPANNYKPRVIIMGGYPGQNPATNTTEVIDLSAQTPQWQPGPPMSQARVEMNATILPNGKVLATGGSLNDEDGNTASLNADLYDPNDTTQSPNGSFSSAGANSYARLYHSNALLLPDATVLLIGGNPQRGTYESRMEIYSPDYMFNPAGRPTIDGVSSTTWSYGGSFAVQTANAADITSVVLIRPGAPTHAFDMDQRLVGLSFTAGAGVLNVTAPPNGNIAPPGYYMLFILNSAGVPSVATFVYLPVPAANQPPTATIVSPSSNVTVQAGGSVSFSGSGSDPDGSIASYAWAFPGGTPASSTQATAGDVNYTAPGTYTASFRVTDNNGAQSAAATRTITVPDFSLSPSPASRSIAPGGTASYSVGLSVGGGFVGTVAFSVAGLPSGASASFTPATLSASGSTTLNVVTSAATAGGSYPLTVTGTTGAITHTVAVTLVVTGDFSLSASPASVTVARNVDAKYTVSVPAGFTGTITLSVAGLPKTVTAKFTPPSIVNAGSSTLNVSTKKNSPTGSFPLTITGTSGSVVHSTVVTLVIQ